MNYWHRRTAQTQIEQDGALYVHPDYMGWKFWLRRFADWAPHYQRAIARIAAQPDVAEYLERSKEPDYVLTDADRALDGRMVREAFGEGCIARWEVTDENGQPMMHTPENAARLLAHFPDIYTAMRTWAADPKHFRPMSDTVKAAVAAGN